MQRLEATSNLLRHARANGYPWNDDISDSAAKHKPLESLMQARAMLPQIRSIHEI
jgi:hypothetical protein